MRLHIREIVKAVGGQVNAVVSVKVEDRINPVARREDESGGFEGAVSRWMTPLPKRKRIAPTSDCV